MAIRIKYTENDYIQKCIDIGLEYIGNHKEPKLGTVIDFICSKHTEKVFSQKIGLILEHIDMDVLIVLVVGKQTMISFL